MDFYHFFLFSNFDFCLCFQNCLSFILAIAFFFFNVQNSITQWLIFFSNTLIKIKLYFCFTNAIFSLIPLRRLGVVLFLLSLSSLFSSAPFVVSVSSEFCFHFFFFNEFVQIVYQIGSSSLLSCNPGCPQMSIYI